MKLSVMTEPTPDEVRSLIAEAAKRFGGSETKLATAAGCSQNAVWAAKRAGRVSAELAVALERATDGEVPRWRLRPDLWSRPTDSASNKSEAAA